MAHATDIVAYTFRADTYCPDCIVGQLTTNPTDARHSEPHTLDAGSEAHLDLLARIAGIDRYDEHTYDSSAFPKVVFSSQVDHDDHVERCGQCGTVIDHDGPVYSVGHNLAGYLPESDVAEFLSLDDAREYFRAMAHEYAETDDDHTYDALVAEWQAGHTRGDYVETEHGIDFGDDAPSMLATVDAILADDGPETASNADGSYGIVVESNQGHPISFWINVSE